MTRLRGKRLISDAYKDGDWKSLRSVIIKMIELLHDALGYNTDEPGKLISQMIPTADAETNGLLSTELWKVLNHVYDIQVDTTSAANTWYVGLAARGSSTSAAVWRIKKVVYDGTSSFDETYADGNLRFDNVWTSRTSLTYF